MDQPFTLTLGAPLHDGLADSTYSWHIGDPYPNPTTGTLKIPYAVASEASIRLEVYNRFGQLIFSADERHRQAGGQEFTLDIADLTPGVYHFKAEINADGKTMIRTGNISCFIMVLGCSS